ncbi:MAG: hypothetical protein R6V50_02000 [Thermoplasmatota archaeon]
MKIKLKYFVVILSIVCILLLYFISTLHQPTSISLSELSSYEGHEVIVQGIVINHYTTQYGGHIIFIKEFNNNTAFEGKIFVEEQTTVEYGDNIQATGKVQQYRDNWEVVVNDARLVQIIQKWGNISFPLWQLAKNPKNYEGMTVNITGIIGQIHETFFYLNDNENQHSLVVNYIPDKSHHVYPGNNVYVRGLFYYDERHLQFVVTVIGDNHIISFLEAE